jgi:anti-repressor protein
MNELLKLDGNGNQTVSARELHEELEIDTPFRLWFPRMCEYGFAEGKDYTPYKFVHPQNQQEITDYSLTLSMAKEIAMIQRTDRGREIRQYLIKVEEAWNTPEMIMARALQMADRQLKAQREQNAALAAEFAALEQQAAADAPKVGYYEALVDRNHLTNFRDTAKEIGIPEKKFISVLEEKGYIYRDSRGRIKPYHDKMEYFAIKDWENSKFTGTQTFITVIGKQHFLRLFGNPLFGQIAEVSA